MLSMFQAMTGTCTMQPVIASGDGRYPSTTSGQERRLLPLLMLHFYSGWRFPASIQENNLHIKAFSSHNRHLVVTAIDFVNAFRRRRALYWPEAMFLFGCLYASLTYEKFYSFGNHENDFVPKHLRCTYI